MEKIPPTNSALMKPPITKKKPSVIIFLGIVFSIIVVIGLIGFVFVYLQKDDVKPIDGDNNSQQKTSAQRNTVSNFTAPKDSVTKYTVGDIEIETFNPVTVIGLEESTNLYFTLLNIGNQAITVSYDDNVVQDPEQPRYFQHFFWMQENTVTLAPQEEAVFEFVVVPEQNQTFDFTFSFVNETQNQTKDILISFDATKEIEYKDLAQDTSISGTVVDSSGEKIKNADVTIELYNGRLGRSYQTDSNGKFFEYVATMSELQQAMGERNRPYSTLGYYVAVSAEGYNYYYKGALEPEENTPVDLNITLTKRTSSDLDYKKIGEYKGEGVHGYWWIQPNSEFTEFVAVQGRHPQELQQKGDLVKIDKQGNKLWEMETEDECWGMDVNDEGLVAAACHRGAVYVVDSDGNLVWEKNVGGQSRDISFSNDGTKLLVGPYQNEPGRADFALLDSSNGDLIWKGANNDEWLRNSQFSPDDSVVIAGMSGGRVLAFSVDDGLQLWENYIGEFPMIFEIDDQGNVYGAGKNRELFSYDIDGDLRFRYAISNHVVTAGSNNMTADGKNIVMGTVGGHLYSFTNEGVINWEQELHGTLQGHNALDITPDGKYILVGSAGVEDQGGYLMLFDKEGNILWEEQELDRRYGTDFPYEHDHNQTGVITVAISDDGKTLAAGYGDSTLRVFERN